MSIYGTRIVVKASKQLVIGFNTEKDAIMQHMSSRDSIRQRVVSVSTISLLWIGLLSAPAQAVTNGQLVPDPKSSAPYVVSIWTSTDSNDYKDAEFLCTGTLISPQVVLTAAHCTTYTTPYFVKVGAASLNDQTAFTQVSAVWTSPRYNPKNFINDVGLLKLTERFEDIKFPTLASPKIAKSINKFSKLQIFGWGLDQNEELAELLRVSNLTLQDSLASKAFGKFFNAKTMISAGRKIPVENVWSGACSGDSGGPLLLEINSINVIVGITSWGSKNCLPNKPSIFARVSYYEVDIKNGIRALESQSQVVDRTAPVATIEPSLIGQAKPGSSLQCSAGSWKNALAITSTWVSPARINGSTAKDVIVLSSDGSSVFKCEVVISSAKASVRRVLTTSITGSAVISSNPVITGISSAMVKSGTTVRCEGWNWRSPVDNERVTWFTSSSSQPSVPVNGRQIGSGSSITLDSGLLRGENGRYLICQVTGSKDGFESHFTASKYLTTPSAPILSSVSINASSMATGSSAICSFNSYSDVESTKIDWGYTAVSGYFTQYAGLSGEQIRLPSDLVQQAAGKYLACRVTLSNSGGEVSKSANTYNIFPSLPDAPNVSTSISGSVVAGSIARCSATSTGGFGSNLSYAWGRTSSNGSRSIEGEVYSRSTTYTLTSRSLENLAGAFLTCVVTLENNAGSVSSASSIAIPTNITSLPNPAAPSFSPISSTKVSVSLPGIPGFDPARMSASLYIYYQTSLTAVGIDGAAKILEVDANSGKVHTGYVILRRLSDGYEVKSTIISFTMPGSDNQGPIITSGDVSYGPLTGIATATFNLTDSSGAESCRATLYNANNIDVMSTTKCSRVSGSPTNGSWRVTFDLQSSTFNPGTYTVKVSATDVLGNVTALENIGIGFTKTGPSVTNLGTLPIPRTIGINYVDQIVLNSFDFGNLGVAPSNYTWTVRTSTSSGAIISSIPVGSNQTYITGLNGSTTYTVVLVATDSATRTKISSPLTSTTLVPAEKSGLTPVFGARTPDYYSPGFKYQIANYDPAYTWTVTSTVGTATINSSGLVSVAPVGAKQSATLTVSTRRTGYTSASASVTSVGPWNLSDEIQTQNITASVSGTTLTVNVPDARGWNWSLIWDNTVQRTNITSFPYVVTGFSTNKSIQLGATDNLQNYGYSRVFLPTVSSGTLTGLTPTFGSRVADSYSGGFKYQITNYDPAYTWSVTATLGTVSISASGLVSVTSVPARQSATLTVGTTRSGYTSASASVTSVGPWNLSDEIQTQNITASLSGTTLTVNVPDARGWNWGLIWDGAVQRTNIGTFPYTVSGFSTNKTIQLYATDSLENYGYSRVFLPTVSAP